MYTHISQDFFQFRLFPGEMQMESLQTFNSYTWGTMKMYRHDSMYFKEVDLSWEIPMLKFPAKNTFNGKIYLTTFDWKL